MAGMQRTANADVQQRLKQRFHKEHYVDYTLIAIIVVLLVFGLIMLYSTSSYEAALDFGGDSAFYFRKQAIAIALGIVVMLGLSFWPHYHLYRHLAWAVYLGSAALIIMVKPFGYTANGAKRWIRIDGVSIQPAEIAKLAMIIFLATLITNKLRRTGDPKVFWTIMASPVPIAALVYGITKNLSSAVIIMGIAFLMLFVATQGYRRFVLMGAAIAGVAAILVYAILNIESSGSMNFRFARVLAWRDPEAYASGKGFQTLQALYAIGSGGIFGKGLGESVQKMGFLPEAQNDMIFSIICEELGMFGAIAVILMYVILIWRLMIIANNARDLFGSLLVVGVMSHISIQVILNIAVVTNMIPNTGITLPFISYGGSAVVLQLAELGIALNVARQIEIA